MIYETLMHAWNRYTKNLGILNLPFTFPGLTQYRIRFSSCFSYWCYYAHICDTIVSVFVVVDVLLHNSALISLILWKTPLSFKGACSDYVAVVSTCMHVTTICAIALLSNRCLVYRWSVYLIKERRSNHCLVYRLTVFLIKEWSLVLKRLYWIYPVLESRFMMPIAYLISCLHWLQLQTL